MHEIAEGLKRNGLMNYMNLATNIITTDGGKELLEAVKLNTNIERILLKFNTINNRIIGEIDTKTNINSAELRRKQVPRYQQAIQGLAVDEELTDELDWKAEQTQQQRYRIEQEMTSEYEMFEQIKRSESMKFSKLKEEYDKVLEEERRMDRKLQDFDKAADSMIKDSETSLSLVNNKLKTMTRHISQIEFDRILYSVVIS